MRVRPTAEDGAPGEDAALGLVRSVLGELDATGIAWCHWKSNEHVLAGLAGATDLDLLVDPAREADCERLLRRHGYVEVINPPVRRIPGLRDYLGMDPDTGVVSHLHVHHRLVLGERHVKEHHLPLEAWLLAGDQRRHGVRVPRPEQELLLLHVRVVLKSDGLAGWRDHRRGRPPVPPAILAELLGLTERVDDDAVARALRESGLPLDERTLRDFLDRARRGTLTPGYLRRTKRELLERLRRYERHGRATALARRAAYRARFDSRVQRLAPVTRKRVPGGGLYVAVVGADGSGKSRLAADLGPWLGRKLDTDVLYFGQPKPDPRWRALRRARRALVTSHLDGRPVEALDTLTWLFLADRRRRLDRRARRHRDRGGVVLAERFPLTEFRSMALPMDGPRLSLRARGRRGLAVRLEARWYDAVSRPDLVLALTAELPLLRERKPETDAREHAGKAAAVQRLQPGDGVVLVDASQPYEAVLLEARRAVWDALRRRAGAP